MKDKEYLNVSDVAAEIEALHMEIAELKKQIQDLQLVVASTLKKD